MSQFTTRKILDIKLAQVFIGSKSIFETKNKNAYYIIVYNIHLRIKNEKKIFKNKNGKTKYIIII